MECLGAVRQYALTGESLSLVRLALPRVDDRERRLGMRLTSSSGLLAVNRHPNDLGGSAGECGAKRPARASIPLISLCKEVN